MSGPDNLATASVHTDSRFFTTNLYQNATLVIAESNIVGTFEATDGPDSFETVIQTTLKSMGVGVPDSHSAIFATCELEID